MFFQKFFILWIVFIPLILNFVSRSEKYYIIPSPSNNASCPLQGNLKCFTLQKFATYHDAENLSVSAIKLIFLPGNHTLQSNLVFSNVESLSLTSSNMIQFMVVVNCKSLTKLIIDEVKAVQIIGIRFINCVNNVLYAVQNATLNDCEFSAFNIKNDTTGTGFIVINSNLYIIRASFMLFQGTEWLMHKSVDGRQKNLKRLGGALVISSHSNATIAKSEFIENKAAIGGAVFVEDGTTIYINECNFTWNEVNCSELTCGYGGVLFANSNSRVFITKCHFDYNVVGSRTSGNEGGVFALFDSTANIQDSKFIKNSVVFGGGVVTCQNTLINIVESHFLNNDAVRGGVLYTERCTIYITNSMFYENIAYLGGVIFDMTSSTFLISSSEFVMNKVLSPGGCGGVFYGAESEISISNNCLFYNNTAYINGGVFDVSESQVLVTDSVFSDNLALAGGGVIKICDLSSVQVIVCYFVGNQAGRDGGVIHGYSSSLLVQDCNFKRNTADDNGGAIFFNDCESILNMSVTFKGNSANSGGAVYNAYGSLMSTGSISINETMTCAGTVYFIHSKVKFLGSLLSDRNSGSLFIFNSQVQISGNIVCLHNDINLQFDSCNNNIEQGFKEGGAISAVLSRVEIEVTVSLENNNATYGAGLLAFASRLYLTGNLQVRHNSAKQSGGGLYLYQCQLQFSGKLYLEKNAATAIGGGIHLISSSAVFFGTEKPGSPKKSKTKVSIVSNSAEMGGGLALEHGSKVYAIANYKFITFSKNTAKKGGAIYICG